MGVHEKRLEDMQETMKDYTNQDKDLEQLVRQKI
jgi:hypothetical protein